MQGKLGNVAFLSGPNAAQDKIRVVTSEGGEWMLDVQLVVSALM